MRVRTAADVRRSNGQVSYRPALAALVAALILGILGMHVLASLDTLVASDWSSGTSSMVSTADGVADEPGDSPLAHASKADDVGMQTGHGSGDGMSILMLCAVMLTAAALTLLGLLVVGSFRPLLPAAFHPAAVRARALWWVRGTGPPHEGQFSVIRC